MPLVLGVAPSDLCDGSLRRLEGVSSFCGADVD